MRVIRNVHVLNRTEMGGLGDLPLIAPVQPSERSDRQVARMDAWLIIRPDQACGAHQASDRFLISAD